MHKSKILLICASPRSRGTSAMLLERIQAATGGEMIHLPQKGSLEHMVLAMQAAQIIVISGPSYINTYPSRLVELLASAAEKGGFSGQKLYGIINGGMPYTHTHQHGLSVLALFTTQNNLTWQGGFVLGGGAMLDGQPLERHLSRKTVVPAFERFIQHISAGAPYPDALYEEGQTPPGKMMTHVFARMLTFMVVRKIKQHGHDPDAPNWYLREQYRETEPLA